MSGPFRTVGRTSYKHPLQDGVVVDNQQLPVHPGWNDRLGHLLERLAQELAAIPSTNSYRDLHPRPSFTLAIDAVLNCSPGCSRYFTKKSAQRGVPIKNVVMKELDLNF